jgi:hemolysin III
MRPDSFETQHQLPWGRFSVAILCQFAAVLALFYFIAPGVFSQEVRQPLSILAWTIGIGLPLSLFEYFYHRYLLHSSILPFMGEMHRAHSTHHGLTYVKAPVNPNEPAKLVEVRSEYPIEDPHQADSMMFPVWSLSIFYAIFFLTLGLPLKHWFPSAPVMLGLFVAVTLFYCAYEVWHAILHLSFDEFWKPLMEGRWTRAATRRMYSFHLMHHWRPNSNLAVVGFWGIALWDHLFRTHRRPERMPLRGAEVNYVDSTLAKPLWPISAIDRREAALYKWSRNVERFFARVFLHRS